jgi:hypothetical protein
VLRSHQKTCQKEKKHCAKEVEAALGMSYTAYKKSQDTQNVLTPQAAEPQVAKPQEVPQSQALGKTPGRNARRKTELRLKKLGFGFTEHRKQFYARKEDGKRLARHDKDVEVGKSLSGAERCDGCLADKGRKRFTRWRVI